MTEPLAAILSATASPQALQWLRETLDQQRKAFHQRRFYYSFSGATRHFSKEAVKVSPDQAAELDAAMPGFTMQTWTEDQLARTLLLLLLAGQTADRYQETLSALVAHADMRESAALFAAFPLLPEPAFLLPLAREALRTNIVGVFDAIALRNPFPARHFDENGWNQMVLKCFFLQRPTHLVTGLDSRANASLAVALSNYAHERWVAHRSVSPDLWRSCAPFITPGLAADLERVAKSGASGDREAAALVAASSDSPLLDALRVRLAPEIKEAREGRLTWITLGRQLYPNC